MSEKAPKTFEAEMRETVVKSSLTGVAATVLAVTAFSPAGFGGMIGTSLATGFGMDTRASGDDNIYANLPAYQAPLSQEELLDIRGQLARTTASLEITRAATESKIEHVRTIALSEGVASFAPLPLVVAAPATLELRLEPSEPTPPAVAAVTAPRDAYLELAELMLAHENL